jgi:hypothetical protein
MPVRTIFPQTRAFALGTVLTVLAAMFTFGGVAASASATGATTFSANDASSLTTALGEVADGDTIQLTGNIDEGTAVRLYLQKSITLDLAGHALTVGLIASFPDTSLDIESSLPGGSLTATPTGLSGGNAGPGIQVNAGQSLTIDSGIVIASGDDGYPGIGAVAGRTSGSITINGGWVTATGGNFAAGIGGSEGEGGQAGAGGGNSGDITITGGTVDASAGGTNHAGAGIGSGFDGDAGPITISGGIVTAEGSDRAAGIGGGENGGTGDITISGGVVNANGGPHGAAIGAGASNYVGTTTTGTISITGGTVTATTRTSSGEANDASAIGAGAGANVGNISITGGAVTANTQGVNAAAVGGTQSGSVGDITISGAGTSVTASNESAAPVVGGGDGSIATGDILIGAGADLTVSQAIPSPAQSVLDATGSSLKIAGTVHVPADNYLAVPAGRVVSIGTAGKVTGHGSIVGAGELDNGGLLEVDSIDDVKTGGTLAVTGNDYAVTFSPSSPNSNATNTDSTIRVYAPSFDALDLTWPKMTDQQAEIFGGWSMTEGGAGNFTKSTTLTSDQAVYGVWNPVTSLQVTPMDGVVSASGSTAFTVFGVDAANDRSDQTIYAQFASNVPSDSFANATATGTFHKSGNHTVTASVQSLSGGIATTGTASVTVSASARTSFTLAPDNETVPAGSEVGFTVTGLDADLNSTGDITSSATLTSSQSGDVFTGTSHRELELTKAGVHVITATIGGQSVSRTITVTANLLDELTIPGLPATITAGSTVDLDVKGADAWGNPLGDKTNESTFGLVDRDSQAGEIVVGNAITFIRAGVRTIGIADGIASAIVTVTVVPAAASTYRFTTARTSVYAGVAYSFGLSKSDRYGNAIAAASTKVKSSASSDHVSGTRVTFSKVGHHTVTATTGGHKFTEIVNVTHDGAYVVVGSPLEVTAGARATVDVLAVAGSSGVRPTGTVRVYYGTKYVSVKLTASTTVSGDGSARVKLPALTAAGMYSIHARYLGSTTYAATDSVQWLNLDVTAGPFTKLAFHNRSKFTVLGQQSFPVDQTDSYGNILGPVTDPVVPTVSGSGFTISGATVTFTKLGTRTVTARYGGHSVSKQITVKNDTGLVSVAEPSSFSTTTATQVSVYASPTTSIGVQITGYVTLHWGTKLAKVKLVAAGGDIAIAIFTVPALKAGAYQVYATYSGAYGFNPTRSPSFKVRSAAS